MLMSAFHGLMFIRIQTHRGSDMLMKRLLWFALLLLVPGSSSMVFAWCGCCQFLCLVAFPLLLLDFTDWCFSVCAGEGSYDWGGREAES